MSLLNNRITAVLAGSVLVVGLGATGAVAGTLITSAQIEDGTIHGRDLNPNLKDRLNNSGEQGLQGEQGLRGETGLQGEPGSDAPAGVADLNSGANYSHSWAGDNGATLNTIVSKCDEGQVAVGGGFSTWGGSDANESGLAYDLGGDNKNIQITVSAPYTGLAYDETKFHGGILPDRWVVKGFNNGDTDQVVRAWVVCSDLAG